MAAPPATMSTTMGFADGAGHPNHDRRGDARQEAGSTTRLMVLSKW
jgi:hypothetical protein